MDRLPSLDNYNVHGPKGVLIQLHERPEATVTESGIMIPKFKAYETEGGRPASKLATEKYSLIGTILQISEKAQETLDDNKQPYKVGDTVSVFPQAKQQHCWFLLDKINPVTDWTGLILIIPAQIEAEVTTTTQNDI